MAPTKTIGPHHDEFVRLGMGCATIVLYQSQCSLERSILKRSQPRSAAPSRTPRKHPKHTLKWALSNLAGCCHREDAPNCRHSGKGRLLGEQEGAQGPGIGLDGGGLLFGNWPPNAKCSLGVSRRQLKIVRSRSSEQSDICCLLS